MNRKIYIIGFLLFFALGIKAQVLISVDDESEPDQSAMLDIQSSELGLLIPSMSTAQMGAISSPALGLTIFNTTENDFYFFNGSRWIPFTRNDGDAWDVDGEDQTSDIGRTGNTGIGTLTPSALLDVAGRIWQTNTGHSVFVGEYVGTNDDLTDNNNIFIGWHTGDNNVSGYNNIGIGREALRHNTSGYCNIAVGRGSMSQNTTGYRNTAVGTSSIPANTTGYENVGIGGYALRRNNVGNYNTCIGKHSLDQNRDGNSNSGAGEDAIYSNIHGHNNSSIGRQSLYHLTGSSNIGFGRNAGGNLTSADSCIIIGSGVNAPSDTDNNQMYLGGIIFGNLATQQIGLGNTDPTESLDVDGALNMHAMNPPSADAGDIYFDGTHLWGYNGVAWVQLDNCASCSK
jgi:hypothetical protein